MLQTLVRLAGPYSNLYEENSFLKSLGLPTKVQDRNIYEVRLNNNMEVESYERQGHPAATH